MKLRCKQCNQTKKVQSIQQLTCDQKNCQLKYPGDNQVLSFDNVRQETLAPTVLEFFETPEPNVIRIVAPANHSCDIPDPHKGEYPYEC